MPNKALYIPPPPAWRGDHLGGDDNLVAAFQAGIGQGRQHRKQALSSNISSHEHNRVYYEQELRFHGERLARFNRLIADGDSSYERARNDTQAVVRDFTNLLDELNRQIGEYRAELATLEGSEHVDIDAAALRAQFEFIKTLPGVMGIRLADNGVAVVLVRTTGEINGHYYDMGDFEIYLGLAPDNDGRGDCYFSMDCCRWPLVASGQQSSHLYFGLYYSRRSNPRAGSFCFGSRVWQIKQLFSEGCWGEFIHAAIACMNSVNWGDNRYSVTEGLYYSETAKPQPSAPEPSGIRAQIAALRQRRMRRLSSATA